MFKNKFFLLLVLSVVAGVIGYTFLGNDTQTDSPQKVSQYTDQTNKERREKDNFFKTGAESPIEDKARFVGLNYFAPNLAYSLMASVVRNTDTTNREVKIPMTDGSFETYEKFGYAEFELNGQPQKLTIYLLDGLFMVLFKDQTAPQETYGGGRYLDIPASELRDDKLPFDFNKAYNPYCTYNNNFACPLPPKENTLATRVESGEKNFEKNE
jgi:uncharacterized protein